MYIKPKENSMEKTFNRKLTCNLGQDVYFLHPDNDMTKSDTILSNQQIGQGMVTKITGSNENDICMYTINVRGNEYTMLQEMFSPDMNQMIAIVKIHEEMLHSDRKLWFDMLPQFREVKYPYKLYFPFQYNQHFESVMTDIGRKDDVTISRCIFSFEYVRFKMFSGKSVVKYECLTKDGETFIATHHQLTKAIEDDLDLYEITFDPYDHESLQ